MAAVRQRVLPEHKIVHHGDGMTRGQKLWNESRAEISGPSGDEDLLHAFAYHLRWSSVNVLGSRVGMGQRRKG